MAYIKVKLIDEQTAAKLSNIDADVETIRASFRALDAITQGMSPESKGEAIEARVESIALTFGMVPKGERNRWQIQYAAEQIKLENYRKGMDSPISDPTMLRSFVFDASDAKSETDTPYAVA